MLDTYIIVVLLTIVGTVTIIILFYVILLCISALRAPPSPPPSALQRRSTRARSIHERGGAVNAPRRQSQRRATENVYMTHPTATLETDQLSRTVTTRDISSRNGHATLTIPSSLFLSSQGHPLRANNVSQEGHELEVLRFYTAEELANFNFEDHQRPQVTSTVTTEQAYEAIPVTVRAGPAAETMTETSLGNAPAMRQTTQTSHHQSVFIRHPDLLIAPSSNPIIESRLQRQRVCYSIPASYIGRPPAYLPSEDQPPSYDDALRLSQVEGEKARGMSPPLE